MISPCPEGRDGALGSDSRSTRRTVLRETFRIRPISRRDRPCAFKVWIAWRIS